MPNTSDFIILKEDHTIGNIIAEHLKKHKNVKMAGYKSTSLSLSRLPSNPHPMVLKESANNNKQLLTLMYLSSSSAVRLMGP